MSLEPLTTPRPTPTENRRRHLRRRLERLAYIACGPENGGILINLSESGLSFHGVVNLTDDQLLNLRFTLPDIGGAIEASGRLVWINDSRRGGGLRFENLDHSAVQRIRKWISDDSHREIAAGAAISARERPGSAPTFDESAKVAALPSSSSGMPTLSLPDLRISPGAPDTPPDSKASTARAPFSDGLRLFQGATTAPENIQHAARRADGLSASKRKPEVVLSAPPVRKSRMVPYTLAALFGCGVAVAAMMGITSTMGVTSTMVGVRAPGNIGQAVTGAPEAVVAGQQPRATRNFQVEVLDANNRRWVLTNDAEAPPSSFSSSRPISPENGLATAPREARISAASASSAPVAPVQAAAAPPKEAFRWWSIQAPQVPRRPAARVDALEPAVPDNFVPPGASFDPSAIAVRSTSLLNSLPNSLLNPAEPVRPSSSIQAALLIERVDPVYPPFARQVGAEGAVQVSATVGKDGVPRAVTFVSGDSRFAASALDSVRQWRYRPALLNGQPVEVQTVITLEFRLKQ